LRLTCCQNEANYRDGDQAQFKVTHLIFLL
jgi:hypothetical protein